MILTALKTDTNIDTNQAAKLRFRFITINNLQHTNH
jgi:hypothetical protein